MTRIKICGLFRGQDIEYVNEAAPDYAGFILDFPRSHRNVTHDQARTLRSLLAPDIRPVCVFVNQSIEDVIRAAEHVRPDVIQLHGSEDNRYITELKERTGLEIWKAFRVRDAADLMAAAASAADQILLDNGYGTGETFDWSKAASFSRPFILAGGLTPANIPEAIAGLAPAAVDISSGVETDRVKDRMKIKAAVQAVRSANEPCE